MAEPASVDAAVTGLRAVAHPVRLRMLSLLTGAEMSAAEIARELGLTHANASYHLRVLARAGQVVEAGEERIRGGVAKRYRYPWREFAEQKGTHGGRRPHEDIEAYIRAVADELVRRSGRRRPRSPRFDADADMWVSPEVWSEVVELVQRASRLVHGAAQPPRSRGTRHVSLTAFAFEMEDRAP